MRAGTKADVKSLPPQLKETEKYFAVCARWQRAFVEKKNKI